ncbi:MAG TPA: hypothetical protein VM537_03970 [Anaerolineae bacterium]|nr:hypothetical protein [Anaerolineae bacterium]
MTDFISLPDSSSSKLATDKDGSERHWQKLKVSWGADGTFKDTTATDPLPVAWGQLNNSRGGAGASPIIVWGRHAAVGTGDTNLSPDGVFSAQSAAVAVQIKAGGSANDDAAGSHAREVTVYGLDGSGVAQSSVIATAGASASAATTETYLRVISARVTGAGTYGNSNAAAIDIETTGAAAQAQIPIGAGRTQAGIYAVPTGKVGYVSGFSYSVKDTLIATVKMWLREEIDDASAPVKPIELLDQFDDLSGSGSLDFSTHYVIPAKAEFYMTALSASGTPSVSARAHMTVL